ncbi:MAG: hypothetical protein KatS3mg031_0161 [Chitinophagales bacterium]|nr:MAG: hypothetical protein KatS3mg031_0161 [Chitinophagales bacterium]
MRNYFTAVIGLLAGACAYAQSLCAYNFEEDGVSFEFYCNARKEIFENEIVLIYEEVSNNSVLILSMAKVVKSEFNNHPDSIRAQIAKIGEYFSNVKKFDMVEYSERALPEDHPRNLAFYGYFYKPSQNDIEAYYRYVYLMPGKNSLVLFDIIKVSHKVEGNEQMIPGSLIWKKKYDLAYRSLGLSITPENSFWAVDSSLANRLEAEIKIYPKYVINYEDVLMSSHFLNVKNLTFYKLPIQEVYQRVLTEEREQSSDVSGRELGYDVYSMGSGKKYHISSHFQVEDENGINCCFRKNIYLIERDGKIFLAALYNPCVDQFSNCKLTSEWFELYANLISRIH